MPSRKRASQRDAKESVTKSLREYGLEWGVGGSQHSIFYGMVMSQVLSHTTAKTGPTEIDLSGERIPHDKEKAIEMIYVDNLEYYHDNEIVNSSCDALRMHLTDNDKPDQILHEAPYYFAIKSGQRRTKHEFKRFKPGILDPLKRFSQRKDNATAAERALECYFDDGLLKGRAFEAIVASYAVHNIRCRRCDSAGSLHWCGGSDTSWRDMYCEACQSCYEIKSKASTRAIRKLAAYDSLRGGSYQRWCEEGFSNRVKGTDYIVLVSRAKVNNGYYVEIGEVGTVLPVVTSDTFCGAKQDTLSIKTVVTLRNLQKWFDVPAGRVVNLKVVFRRAFEAIFPGQWVALTGYDKVADTRGFVKESDSIRDNVLVRESLENLANEPVPKSLEQLADELRLMQVPDNWDDSDESNN